MHDDGKVASAKMLLGSELPEGWVWKVRTTRNDPKIPGYRNALTLPLHRRTIHLFQERREWSETAQCRRVERVHCEHLIDYMKSSTVLPQFCLDCLEHATIGLKWGS